MHADRQKIDVKLTNVPLYVYQSMLGRTLCKLWFLNNVENNDQRNSENEFKLFVNEEVRDLSFDDNFLELARGFFGRARNGIEPSLEIPNTRVMKHLKEEQIEIAKEHIQDVHESLKGTLLDWLKRSDLKR